MSWRKSPKHSKNRNTTVKAWKYTPVKNTPAISTINDRHKGCGTR